MSWLAPHSLSFHKHWAAFADNMPEEISAGWLRGTWAYPPTVPLSTVPCAVIPEPRCPHQYRIIWNASVPGQHVQKSLDSNGAGLALIVATNAAAELPFYLAIAWLSIERVY